MDTAGFYDALAGEYHLIFQDWWTTAEWQGDVLSGLLAAQGISPGASVLDCTCGIGTQALPLAARGYRVAGTDLSSAAVARASAEAAARGIDVRLVTADVRFVADVVDGRFDVVISCDNSLPHLLTDDDLGQALGSIRRCLKPGGLFVASMRDYDSLVRDRVPGMVPTIRQVDGRQRIVGQAWKWAADYRTVEITLFVLQESPGSWQSTVVTTTYRALLRHEMTAALDVAGFTDIQWPEDTGYYQPIVIARR